MIRDFDKIANFNFIRKANDNQGSENKNEKNKTKQSMVYNVDKTEYPCYGNRHQSQESNIYQMNSLDLHLFSV
jgi:hypothetical protein